MRSTKLLAQKLYVLMAVACTRVDGRKQAGSSVSIKKWSDDNFLQSRPAIFASTNGSPTAEEVFGPQTVASESGTHNTCPSSLHYIYQVDVDVSNYQAYGKVKRFCYNFSFFFIKSPKLALYRF